MTVEDSFPLPRCDKSLGQLTGSQVCTSLDSAGAFHTIPVAKESRLLTTFYSPLGIWQFCRMPFGIQNGLAIYSQLIQKALAHLDDVIVHSKTTAEYLECLELILDAHRIAGMKLKLSKCFVAKSTVEYLGHTVHQDGISMTDSYVERVLSWLLPKSGADLRSFLGVP